MDVETGYHIRICKLTNTKELRLLSHFLLSLLLFSSSGGRVTQKIPKINLDLLSSLSLYCSNMSWQQILSQSLLILWHILRSSDLKWNSLVFSHVLTTPPWFHKMSDHILYVWVWCLETALLHSVPLQFTAPSCNTPLSIWGVWEVLRVQIVSIAYF